MYLQMPLKSVLFGSFSIIFNKSDLSIQLVDSFSFNTSSGKYFDRHQGTPSDWYHHDLEWSHSLRRAIHDLLVALSLTDTELYRNNDVRLELSYLIWNFSGNQLTGVKAMVKEIEDAGVWFEFDNEEDESFVTYGEMHLFIREGSTSPPLFPWR